MNLKKIKVVAAILAMVTIVLLIPSGSVAGAKASIPELLDMEGTDFTDNSYIAGKLQELFDLLPYSDYPYFTTYGNKSCGNSICSYCNGKNVAKYHPNLKDLGVNDGYDSWSCFGFARYAFLYIFGVKADGLNYYGNTTSGTLRRVGRVAADTYDLNSISGGYDSYTIENLESLLKSATPGDIVQGRTRKSSGTGNHTMIFLEADDDGIYVLQNNMYKERTDKDGNYYGYNRVMISFMSYAAIKNTWNSIVTVYRADKDTYTETWSKGNNICIEHSYTSEGGDLCVDCGHKYQRKIANDTVGMYTLKYASNVREQPYTGSNVIKTLPEGTVVTIVANETNSLGQKWLKTAEGQYIYYENASSVNQSEKLTVSMTSYPSGQLKLYNSFELRGRILSLEGDVESVTGMFINNANGKVLQQDTVYPSATSFDIGSSNINYHLKFGQLAIGEYTFVIIAKDSEGNYNTFCSVFEISGSVSSGGKVEQKAPSAPILSTKYDVYVILEYDNGYEYSMDMKNWYTGGLFTGLEPNTEYTFYRRLAATSTAYASPASPGLKVRTLKEQKAAEAPTLSGAPTDTTVTLTYVKDYEYSKDGIVWQSSNVFKGLSPATDYAFYQRDKDTRLASKGLLVRTLKVTLPAPEAPMILFCSDVAISVSAIDGYEYAIIEANGMSDIVWQKGGEFTGLSPAKAYHIYCRIAETETTFASPISKYTEVVTDKSYPEEIPDVPVVIAKNSYSITLKAVPGVEFSLDGEHFTSSNVLSGLVPGTVYSIVCRYAETDTAYSSFNSDEIYVEVIPDKITSDTYKIDELNKFITEVPSGTTVGLLVSNLDYGRYTKVYDNGTALGIATLVSTGNKVVVADEYGASTEYTVVVKGDLNGDGIINITDLVGILSIFSGEEPTKLAFVAADVTGDGYINAVDYAIVKYMVNTGETKEQYTQYLL